MLRLKYPYAWLSILLSLVMVVSVPSQAQEPISEDIYEPEFTCSSIPYPVTTDADFIAAVNAADDETTCPGADVIDLGGRTITLTTRQSSQNPTSVFINDGRLTIRNGTLERDPNAGQFRFINVTPGSELILENVTLRNGSVAPTFNAVGGAIFANGASVTILNSTLEKNSALDGGGAVFFSAGSNAKLVIADSTFADNSTDSRGGLGGGALLLNGSDNNIIRSQFIGNTAVQEGGAIYTYSNSSTPIGTTTIFDSVFQANDAGTDGGALYIQATTANLVNTLISGNRADRGGGIFFSSLGSVNLTNVTMASNFAVSETGGFAASGNNFAIRNSIFWGNNNSIFYNDASASVVEDDFYSGQILGPRSIGNSIIEGSIPAGVDDAGGNLDVNPLFVDAVAPADAPTTAGDYRVFSPSPAVDAGDNSVNTGGGRLINEIATDLLGDDRIQNTTIDMGAYETSVDYPTDSNVVSNGDFSNGLTDWLFFGQGSRNINNGEARFFRNPGFQGASFFQNIDVPVFAGLPYEVTANIGNASNVPKGVEVTLRAPNFAQSITCSLTVPPNTAPQPVTLQGIATVDWSGMVLTFRSYDPDGIPAIRLDDVSVQYRPNAGITGYNCSGFPAPANTQLLNNGNFSNGLRYWVLFGGFDFQINNGVMNLWRTSGSANPAVLFQNEIGHHLPSAAPLRAQLQLGNSSNVAKDVEVFLRDVNFAQSLKCEYTIPANTPLTPIIIQVETTQQWSRPLVLLRVLDDDDTPAVLVDNVSLQVQPSLTVGQNCPAPSFSSVVVPDNMKAPTTLLPDAGALPDTGDNAVPVPVAPPNPGGIPEIPGF